MKEILTKNNLITQLEEKCQSLEITINMFFTRIEDLNQKGLPSLFVINDKLITQEYYIKKMKKLAKDSSNFANIKGSMTSRAFLEAMGNDFYIQHEVNHIFVAKPIFAKYIEVDEIYWKVTKLTIPDEDRWDKLCDLLD